MTSRTGGKPMVVGIGASAGGLAPLKKFVGALPENTGFAFIVVQHLDPAHESMLAQILGRDCRLQVKDAEYGEDVRADTVYVIPPDAYLELLSGAIKLSQRDNGLGARKAIDHFFRSLAREGKNGCAGVVLSGSGSDGTAGLRAIRASGGLALVQDPDQAEHRSMPQSAIEADVADKVVNVEDMYPLLRQYADHPMTRHAERRDDGVAKDADSAEESLDDIAAILNTHEDFDVAQYKPATIQRRIARRMSLTNAHRYKDYLQLLRDDPKERRLLTKDLLINVTDFFRDSEAFAALQEKVIPALLANVDEREDIRVWVAGCASGEEAYSIAILLLEATSRERMKNGIRIFATDIDEDAIGIARKGIYPESIAAEVPEEYLNKYFLQVEGDHHYKVKNQVRDLISFATQNVATHPPFHHMQLIACRNLLIYFNKQVQEKVLASFYFSLDDRGHLFLGSSESLGSRSDLFKTVSKKWRVYQKIPGASRQRTMADYLQIKQEARFHQKTPRKPPAQTRVNYPSRAESMRQAILKTQVSAALVVNEEGTLLYSHGELDSFCHIPQGEPTHELTQLVKEELRSRLRSAFYKVRKHEQPLTFQSSVADGQGQEKRTVQVRIVPIADQDFTDGTAYTISFAVVDASASDARLTREDGHDVNAALEQELAATREELQNTIEELETSSEELKASHEEALSTNEELQSSNEELEASSEELRSLNEELSTVNAQLKDKVEELRRAHDDVENFFASTHVPTLFLNPELKIQRYTPAAGKLLKLDPLDIGREILTLDRELVDENLADECTRVLDNLQPIEKEILERTGRWFIRLLTPYCTEERRIEGVVVVFQEITELKRLSQRAEGREQQQAVVARLGMLALNDADPEELMQQAVRQVAHVLDAEYCKVLKYQPELQNLILKAGVGWHESIGLDTTVPDSQNSQAGYTLLSKEPVIVKNLAEEKRFSGPELLTQHKVVSGISCVINHSSPPYGVLGVHTRSERDFTKDDGNFLQSVANILSVALRTKEAKDNVLQSEERLKIARDAAQIGIHDYDIVNDTIVWDENHRSMWGVSEDLPITYAVFEQGLHPDDREKVRLEIENAKQEPGKYRWEFRVVHQADGAVRHIAATGDVIHKDGRAVRIVGTVQDITERKHLELSLQDAVRELRESDSKKNEFLSILGHELRNPLAALHNAIEGVALSNADSTPLRIMKRSVVTMSGLLDDLLDLERISQSKIQLRLQPVNIGEILENVVEQTDGECGKKGQTVSLEIGENLTVLGDPQRLEQVFTNLIINAIKYTPAAGNIKLTAGKSGETVHVDVRDNGIGIGTGDLDKVFDPFYQVKPEDAAAHGLGIGLALAKKLVEMHQGKIWASSDGRDGSTFSVSLPAVPHTELDSNDESVDAELRLRPGLRVLLIEDNEDILFAMPALLEALGCEVETAISGRDGVRKVDSFKPEVLLVDIGLPDMSGHEVGEQVRAAGYRGVMAAISGYSHGEMREKSMQVGFDYHLAKPAALPELKQVFAAVR